MIVGGESTITDYQAPFDQGLRQTCKEGERGRKRAAACFLTAIGPVITKTADRKTIMNYHTRGQTRKTIIDYHEEFELAQTE